MMPLRDFIPEEEALSPIKNISKLGMFLAIVAILLFQLLAPPPATFDETVSVGRSLLSGAIVCGSYVLGYVIELALKKK